MSIPCAFRLNRQVTGTQRNNYTHETPANDCRRFVCMVFFVLRNSGLLPRQEDVLSAERHLLD